MSKAEVGRRVIETGLRRKLHATDRLFRAHFPKYNRALRDWQRESSDFFGRIYGRRLKRVLFLGAAVDLFGGDWMRQYLSIPREDLDRIVRIYRRIRSVDQRVELLDEACKISFRR